ncbi:MAG: hypothetical protein ACOC1K_05655 [Nanoarchaeota archaeon]
MVEVAGRQTVIGGSIMFEDYLIWFLFPVGGMVITSILMSIWIFWPEKREHKKTKYKSEYYGEYWKEKKYPNVSDIIHKEIAKRQLRSK